MDKVQMQGILEKGYGIIPKMLMSDESIDIEAKAIYGYLASFAGGGASAFPGVCKILHDLNISENRFYKYRKQLVDRGYITVQSRRKEKTCGKQVRDSNLYILNTQIPQHLHFEGVQNEGIQNEGTNNNSININIYTKIFEYWNSKSIIVHKKISSNIKKAIGKVIKEYSEEEVLEAIDNYSDIIKDEGFYYEHIWSLEKFLKQGNGISRFTSDGDIFNNYLVFKNKNGTSQQGKNNKENRHKEFAGY